MKLQQNQVWKQGELYYGIVRLERLEVEYKVFSDQLFRQGTHHHVSKKQFCRLIRNAELQPPRKNSATI